MADCPPEEVIGNNRGVLVCEPLPPVHEPRALPSGTYADSCDGCVLEGEGDELVLRCEQCKSADGQLRSSELALRSCGGDGVIGNHNGALACELGQGAFHPDPRAEL